MISESIQDFDMTEVIDHDTALRLLGNQTSIFNLMLGKYETLALNDLL